MFSRLGYCLLAVVLLAFSLLSQTAAEPNWKSFWPNTDFRKTTIKLSSIRSGGPPKDGIPSIDRPQFVSVEAASKWISPREPVIFLELGGDQRIYPLQILIWHEIVNDEVGGIPVSVTFCPLCYSAIAFDRRLAERTYDFGTSGLLRHSDMVMYDRQTESLWQQLVGEAIVGEMAGKKLEMIPVHLIGFAEVQREFPNAKVLSRATGHRRDYGRNPYAGYDDINQTPFLLKGKPSRKVKPMEHLVTVELEGQAVAYPYSVLRRSPVINDQIGSVPVAVFFTSSTGTALGAERISAARSVGSGAVFDRRIDDRVLTFRALESGFEDLETGSHWNLFGVSTAGPLRGRKLKQVVSGDFFGFAWMVFRPETRLYRR